jgi:PAS domain-containing protein
MVLRGSRTSARGPDGVGRGAPVTRGAGAFLVALGSTVLFGWAVRSDLLLRLRPGSPSMQPATAACFVCLGVALVAMSARGTGARWVAAPAATLAAAVAVLNLSSHGQASWRPLESLLFAEAVAHDPRHGDMAVATAVLVLLICAGLLLALAADRLGGAVAAQVMGMTALTGSVLASLDQVYGSGPYPGDVRSVMAVHTAVGLAVASVGLLSAVPGGVAPRVLGAPGPGSAVRRRLLITVILVLPLVGWLRLKGERSGLYGTSFGLAVMVLVAGVLVCGTAWRAAEVADRSGAMLRDAWQRLGSRNAHLERQVAEQAADLTAARAQLHAVVQAVTEAVVVVDATGRVVLANAPAARLLARTETGPVAGEVVGTSLATLGDPIRDTPEGRVYVVPAGAHALGGTDPAAPSPHPDPSTGGGTTVTLPL